MEDVLDTYAFAACEAGCPNLAHVFPSCKVECRIIRTVRQYIGDLLVYLLTLRDLGGFFLVDCVEAFLPLLLSLYLGL